MECLGKLSLGHHSVLIPLVIPRKGGFIVFPLAGLGTSYFLSEGEAVLRSEGSGHGLRDSHSPCLWSPRGTAVALSRKEQSQSRAVPLGLYSPAPGSP